MTQGRLEVLGVAIEAGTSAAEAVVEVDRIVSGSSVRVLGEVHVLRNADGSLAVERLDGASIRRGEEPARTGGSDGDPHALLDPEDLHLVAGSLESGCSALVVVLEHAWLAELETGLAAIGGHVTFRARVPAGSARTAVDHPGDRSAGAARPGVLRRATADTYSEPAVGPGRLRSRAAGLARAQGDAGRGRQPTPATPGRVREPVEETPREAAPVAPRAFVDRLVALGMLYQGGDLTLAEFVAARRRALDALTRATPSDGGS